MRANHALTQPIPPHNPNCERIFSEGAPPNHLACKRHRIPDQQKRTEPLQLECKTGNDVSKVYWYIDDVLYKSAQAGTKQFFMPPEGQVKISCVDDKGRNRDITVVVKKVDW